MKSNLLLLAVVGTLTGCSSPLLRPVTTGLLAGGGAATGSALSHGRPVGAFFGGLFGTGLGEAVFQIKTKAEQHAYDTGYKEALAEQMKSQYWQQQFRHWPATSPTLQVPVSLPERVTADGVRLVPSTEFIPIHP